MLNIAVLFSNKVLIREGIVG